MATKTNQFKSLDCLFQNFLNGCNAAVERVLVVWLRGGRMRISAEAVHNFFLKKAGLGFPETMEPGKKNTHCDALNERKICSNNRNYFITIK